MGNLGVGRPPKPTAQHKKDGTYTEHRHGGRNEPKFGAPSMTPPSSLDALAKKEWKRLAAPLQEQGLFTMADRHVFAVYCQAVSDWTKLNKKINAMKDLTFTTANGYVGVSPLMGARQKAWQTLKEGAARFGLDPASRTRIDASPVGKKGETDEDYLFGDGDGPKLEK